MFDIRKRSRLAYVVSRVQAATSRLDRSLDPRKNIVRFRNRKFSWRSDGHYVFLAVLALINLSYSQSPPPIARLGIVLASIAFTLIPATSQFFIPASPILSWLLLFWASRFIPTAIRPHIWVSVLPTLESVLYGANISDILTRVTHPILDLAAWLPYGIGHYSIPFVVSAVIFVFAPPGAVKFFGRAFGYMNLLGVAIQILFPCSPPWYEIREGLTPAKYGMSGSPGGLARIDAILGTNMYTNAFSGAPLVFGAFPSLHAGAATMEALFLSHFFPQYRIGYWLYCGWLYWSTMYLTHHYLIDVVAGGGLAICSFYFFLALDDTMRHLPLNFQDGSASSSSSSTRQWHQLGGYSHVRTQSATTYGADSLDLDLENQLGSYHHNDPQIKSSATPPSSSKPGTPVVLANSSNNNNNNNNHNNNTNNHNTNNNTTNNNHNSSNNTTNNDNSNTDSSSKSDSTITNSSSSTSAVSMSRTTTTTASSSSSIQSTPPFKN